MAKQVEHQCLGAEPSAVVGTMQGKLIDDLDVFSKTFEKQEQETLRIEAVERQRKADELARWGEAEEKRRQDFICGFKLGISRIVWADLWGEARIRARERLRREYLDTTARVGESSADLEPFLIRRNRLRAG